MNATMGGPAGGVPVTSLERRQFVNVDIPLTSSSNARAAAHGAEKKEKGTVEDLPEEGVYEVQIPYPDEGELLPSFDKKETDNGEPAMYFPCAHFLTGFAAAGASVVWYLELEGARKGWFRTNDKCGFFPHSRSPISLI